MEHTVVGVYDSYAQAESAMNELLTAGFSRENVQLRSARSGEGGTEHADAYTGSGIGHFFRTLFGGDEEPEQGDIYAEAVRRGACVLTAGADNEQTRDLAVEIMNRHDPVDMDERAVHWRSQGWSGYDEKAPPLSDEEIQRERAMYAQSSESSGPTSTTSEEQRVPVVEGELRVGKREVQKGGVRVHQRVTAKPVQERVELREEHVKVERHPVDQPATEDELAAFKEGEVEMREMTEEPVVSKTARVVEEVVVSKEAEQRTEEISDTVRRADVEVEQIAATSDDADFRRHWQSAYGTSGGRYEDYDAAYRYGSSMAGTERFKNYQWQDVEPQLRNDWEAHHPESTWEKVKDAVRYGAEKVTGRH